MVSCLMLIFRLNIYSFATLVHHQIKSSKSTTVDDHIRLICQLVQAFQLSLTMQLVFHFNDDFCFTSFQQELLSPSTSCTSRAKQGLAETDFLQISRSVVAYLPPEYKRGRSGCEDHLPKDPVSQGRSAVEISFFGILKYWLQEGKWDH